MSDAAKVRGMLAMADRLGEGVAQAEMVESAVRLADTTRDTLLMFDARLDLIEAATHSGRAEKMLAAFTWCLSQYDKEPDQYVRQHWLLLWHFKNIVHAAIQFPSISLKEIDQVLAQMKGHYQRGGYSTRPVNYLAFIYKMETGRLEEAAKLLAKWRKETRDSLADCVACEANNVMEYQILEGRWKRALAAAEPNLNGSQSCLHMPHSTYAYALKPLAKLGRVEEADQYQAKGYRMIRENPVFLRELALHVSYLLHRDRERAAINLMERHISWALDTYEMLSRHVFLAASRNVLRRLPEKAKRKRALKFPRTFPLYDDSNKYDVAALVDWFESEVQSGGATLDRRSGTDYATTKLIDDLEY